MSRLQESMRFLYCVGFDRFCEIFGGREIGEHLWNKLYRNGKCDPAHLICELDGSNIRLLERAIEAHLAKHMKDGVQ